MSKPVNWPTNQWLTVGDYVADAGPSAQVYFYNNGSALLANANECYCLRECPGLRMHVSFRLTACLHAYVWGPILWHPGRCLRSLQAA